MRLKRVAHVKKTTTVHAVV